MLAPYFFPLIEYIHWRRTIPRGLHLTTRLIFIRKRMTFWHSSRVVPIEIITNFLFPNTMKLSCSPIVICRSGTANNIRLTRFFWRVWRPVAVSGFRFGRAQKKKKNDFQAVEVYPKFKSPSPYGLFFIYVLT